MSKRSSVQLIERDEPAFIKKFKARTGFVEPCDLSDKTEIKEGDNSCIDSVEDLPTIEVIPGKSKNKVTSEDVRKVHEQLIASSRSDLSSGQDCKVVTSEKNDSGKFKFSLPSQEQQRVKNSISSSAQKEKSRKLICSEPENIKNDHVKVSNKCLLSFGDGEEDSEDD